MYSKVKPYVKRIKGRPKRIGGYTRKPRSGSKKVVRTISKKVTLRQGRNKNGEIIWTKLD